MSSSAQIYVLSICNVSNGVQLQADSLLP